MDDKLDSQHIKMASEMLPEGTRPRPNPPVSGLVVGMSFVFMTIFLSSMALTKLQPDMWFVKTFLSGGKVWIWNVAVLSVCARVGGALDRRFKRSERESNTDRRLE